MASQLGVFWTFKQEKVAEVLSQNKTNSTKNIKILYRTQILFLWLAKNIFKNNI